MSNEWTKNTVTNGYDKRGTTGSVDERIQPNLVTGGYDVYEGSRLTKRFIPNGVGGYNEK